MNLVRGSICVVAVLLALPAAAPAQTCPADPAAFTIVSTEVPEWPGGTLEPQGARDIEGRQLAKMEVDVPGAGELKIVSDDGFYDQGYAYLGEYTADAAGRLSTELQMSTPNYLKYSGAREDGHVAGKEVTVGYTVTFTRSVPAQCKGGDPNAPDPSTTQTFSITYKPYPVLKVRLALSSETPGRYVGKLSCTDIHEVVCGRHLMRIGLYRDGKLLFDDLFQAKDGRVKFNRVLAREIKKKRRVKATLWVQFRGSTLPNGFAAEYDLAFNTLITQEVTLRKGKLPDTVVIGTNVKGNKDTP